MPNLNTSGGGGSYTNRGNGGVYKDSNTPTRHQIRDMILGEADTFLSQNVWNTQDPYDKWNELTECERDFLEVTRNIYILLEEIKQQLKELLKKDLKTVLHQIILLLCIKLLVMPIDMLILQH